MRNGPLKGQMAAQAGCNPVSITRASPFLRRMSGCCLLFSHGHFPTMQCGGLMVFCTQHASKSAPQSPLLQWTLPTICTFCFTSQISYISWSSQHADVLCQTISNQRGKSEKLSENKGDCPRKSQSGSTQESSPSGSKCRLGSRGTNSMCWKEKKIWQIKIHTVALLCERLFFLWSCIYQMLQKFNSGCPEALIHEDKDYKGRHKEVSFGQTPFGMSD